MFEPHTWGNAHHIRTYHDWLKSQTEITFCFTDMEIQAAAGHPSSFLINSVFRSKQPVPAIAGTWRRFGR